MSVLRQTVLHKFDSFGTSSKNASNDRYYKTNIFQCAQMAQLLVFSYWTQ